MFAFTNLLVLLGVGEREGELVVPKTDDLREVFALSIAIRGVLSASLRLGVGEPMERGRSRRWSNRYARNVS